MTIAVNLMQNPGFYHKNAVHTALAAAKMNQTQQFKNVEIQNGYGTATTVSVTPGYGATVSASIDIQVTTVSKQTFDQIINEVKKSSSYQNSSSFRSQVDSASYESAASSSSGIFGWLVGKKSSSYTNKHSDITQAINAVNSGNAHDDVTVANSVASIMVKNTSKVHVTANVQVTGQLLTPSPTVIAVQTTTFSFTDQKGNKSSVSMINQSPLVPVDANTGTVSQNGVSPGSKLTLAPISG